MSTLTEDAAHRRMLIVDEDRHNYDDIRDHFLDIGYECEVALDQDTALDILGERQMDLIALNAEMSEDDEQMIERFKEACPGAGLVVYNGTCEKTEQRRLRRVGADSYMSEASDLSAVIRAIERVMNGG